MNGYRFDLTCGACGADCHPVTLGRPLAGTFTSAIAGCTECGRQWQVEVFLRPVGRTAREHAALSKERAKELVSP